MAVLGFNRLIALRDQLFEKGTYDLDGFQAASYELRVDNKELLINGKYYKEYGEGVIEIPPHQIVFLSTMEVVHLPHNITAEVMLRFEYAIKGLVLLGGYIDPLFEGRIYLVVNNLSDKPVVVKPGDRLAIIVFYEVDFDQEKSSEYNEIIRRFKKVFRTIPHDIIEDWQGRHMLEIYKKIREHSEAIISLQQQINSTTAISQYVIWGGVFLITMTVLGAILQTVFGAWSSTLNIGSNLGSMLQSSTGLPPILGFLLLLLVPLFTVMLFMLFILIFIKYVSDRIYRK
jgi:deoxycytidine triphosphate deaminase